YIIVHYLVFLCVKRNIYIFSYYFSRCSWKHLLYWRIFCCNRLCIYTNAIDFWLCLDGLRSEERRVGKECRSLCWGYLYRNKSSNIGGIDGVMYTCTTMI